MLSTVAANAISRMLLAPTMTRDSTSRPSWSVPNQCAADGAWLVARSCWASGLCGAMTLPKIAQISQNSRITAPATNVGLRSSSRQGVSSPVWSGRATATPAAGRDRDVGHPPLPSRSRGFSAVLSASAVSVATM